MLRSKVVIYITQGDRLLVFRHVDYPEAGIQVPAGTIEAGVSPETAAWREAREETGLEKLEMLAFLGTRDFDLTPYGLKENHRRYFYHMACRQPAPASWQHAEEHPSDGSPGPILFEYSWAKMPEDVPELNGELGMLLPEVKIERENGVSS